MEKDHKMTEILLVEDNLDDIAITKRAFNEAKLANKMWIVRDGEEALNFLQHTGEFEDISKSPKPGLILLDINMPKINGLDVLKVIKESPNLKGIPTVILTVSKKDEDIVKGYDYGCNSFIQKPVEFEKFVEVVRQIGLYWGLLNIGAPDGL